MQRTLPLVAILAASILTTSANATAETIYAATDSRDTGFTLLFDDLDEFFFMDGPGEAIFDPSIGLVIDADLIGDLSLEFFMEAPFADIGGFLAPAAYYGHVTDRFGTLVYSLEPGLDGAGLIPGSDVRASLIVRNSLGDVIEDGENTFLTVSLSDAGAPIPEPGAALLFGAGALVMRGAARRRKR